MSLERSVQQIGVGLLIVKNLYHELK